MRNQIDKEAEKWYIDLRRSAYRYLARYKQRIDSLLSYQKTLHEFISNTKKNEVKIRAISELHSIEMDIFSLWKQLPVSNIVSTVDNSENERKSTWAVKIDERKIPQAIVRIPLADEKEEDGFEPKFWANDNNHRKESEAWTVGPPPTPAPPLPETMASTLTTEIQETIPIPTQEPEPTQSIVQEPEQDQDQEQKPKDIVVDIDILGRWPKPFDVEPWVQCNFNNNNSNCNKWFKTKEIRSKHIAKYHT